MNVLIIGHNTPENRKAFLEAESQLKLNGNAVLNPAKLFISDQDDRYQLRMYLTYLSLCNSVIFIENYFDFKHANIIQAAVLALELEILRTNG